VRAGVLRCGALVPSQSYVLNRYSRILMTSHKNMNIIFRLCNPVYDIDTSIFKVTVIIKQARHE